MQAHELNRAKVILVTNSPNSKGPSPTPKRRLIFISHANPEQNDFVLRTLRFENGKVNTALITADRRLPSLYLMKKAFGSLSSAYREAGIA